MAWIMRGPLCAALKAIGIAVWSIEYRRVGSTGGGWPMTFQDVAAGFDYAATLAKTYPLDLGRVIAWATHRTRNWRSGPVRWAEMARRQGDDVTVTIVPGVDHFDVVDPQSKAWFTVHAAVLKLLHASAQ